MRCYGVRMRWASIVFGLGCGVVAGCGADPLPIIELPADGGVAGEYDSGVADLPDSGVEVIPTIVQAGDVSGAWSGEVHVEGAVLVPAGQVLEIAAGSRVIFSGNFGIRVDGTLRFNGSDSMIMLEAGGAPWLGVRVNSGGTLSGSGVSIYTAGTCITGLAGSMIELSSSVLVECGRGLSLANGGTFSRVTIIGGGTNQFDGGMVNMTDSTIDLRGNPSVDCTDWAGGGARLDHVRFTGCHCPLHFNSTSDEVMITNSIFDNGANAVMIARSTAVFTGNNLETTQAEMLDIGGSINANIAGNYWGGGPPQIASGNRNQFTGADQFETSPIPGAGPR